MKWHWCYLGSLFSRETWTQCQRYLARDVLVTDYWPDVTCKHCLRKNPDKPPDDGAGEKE